MDAEWMEAFWESISRAGEKTALIHAGLELQIWAKIAAGYRTVNDFVEHDGWDLTGVRILLDGLYAIDLLEKSAAGYHLVPIAEQTLLPASSDYQAGDLLMEWAALGHSQLANTIRTGIRPLIEDVSSDRQAAAWATLPGTVGFHAPDLIVPQSYWLRADSLWRAAGIEARDGLRILDVGSGPGVLSMALARQHPGVIVTQLDRQPELNLAHGIAEKQGLNEQLRLIPGDMRALDYGKNQFDVVLFGSCLMFFSPEENVSMLRKAYSALVNGGVVVITQYITDEARIKSREALINAVWIYASTAHGDAYTISECQSFLENAGFTNVTEKELSAAEKLLIMAMKV